MSRHPVNRNYIPLSISEDEIARLRRQCFDMQRTVDTLRGEGIRWEQALGRRNATIADQRRDLDRQEKQIEEQKQLLDRQQQEIERLRIDLDNERKRKRDEIERIQSQNANLSGIISEKDKEIERLHEAKNEVDTLRRDNKHYAGMMEKIATLAATSNKRAKIESTE